MSSAMILETADRLSKMYFENAESDLEGALAKFASDGNLNANMVERIANRANRNIIMGLQKQARSGSADPHFTFPTIKTAKVIAVLRARPNEAPGGSPLDMAPPVMIGARPSLPSLTITPPQLQPIPEPIPTFTPKMGLMDAVLCLKEKLAEKQSALRRLEMALDEMLCSFHKRAANELLGGMPVQVFEALPVDMSPVLNKLASWGHRLQEIHVEWELDTDHPLVKMAFEIDELEGRRESFERDIRAAQAQLDKARSDLNAATV